VSSCVFLYNEMFFRRAEDGRSGRLGEGGFAEIVREHQAMVFSIGWHLTGDRAIAEELAQDVFLKLYENRESIVSREHVKHWLRRVATQRAIDYSRRVKLRPRFGLEGIRERIGMLGGKVRISSAKGKGARLEIRVPAERSGLETLFPSAEVVPLSRGTTAGETRLN